MGAISGSLLQSAQVATVLLLPLVQAGLLGLAPVAVVIFGASLGTGIGRFLVAGGVDLPGRRLTLAGVLVRALGTMLLVVLFWVEVYAGVPLTLGLVSAITANPALQAGLVYLASQVVIALVGEVAGFRVTAQVEQWLPDPAAKEPLDLRPAYVPNGK